MMVKTLHVRNFRAIRDAILPCDTLTALVGANGCGKSAFLAALALFFNPTGEYGIEDFHARNTGESIGITVTFTDLSPDEEQLFAKYVESAELTVEKEMTFPRGRGSQRYFGTSLANPDFRPYRETTVGAEKREIYGQLRQDTRYSDLPPFRNMAQGEGGLAQWEADHPGSCERMRDGGQFFGFREVGEAHLERSTGFVLVPAVREADDEAGGAKDAALSQLMELVVIATMAQRDDITSFREATQKQYSELTDPETSPELQGLEATLTATLSNFAPDAMMHLDWQQQTIELPWPKARAELEEDGYRAPISRTGHGLQRALVLTLLQHLAAARASHTEAQAGADQGAASLQLPGLILAIEEPELFQHPSRQRVMAQVLRQLSAGEIPGVARQTQVLYATHSPLFVGLDRFDQVRILRKEAREPGLPKETVVYSQTLSDVKRKLDAGRTTPYTEQELRAALRGLMTPLANEAFFASSICLLEGPNDHSMFQAYAQARGVVFDAMGVCLVICDGKGNIPKALAVFSGVGIPTYPVFDGDEGKSSAPDQTARILQLLGITPEEYSPGVHDRYAAFRHDMKQSAIQETLGMVETGADSWCTTMGLPPTRKWQSVPCLTSSFESCLGAGTDCTSLGMICNRLTTPTLTS